MLLLSWRNCKVFKAANQSHFSDFTPCTVRSSLVLLQQKTMNQSSQFTVPLHRETKDNDGLGEDKQWQMMNDVSLQNLVKEAKEALLFLSDEREQYAVLAR